MERKCDLEFVQSLSFLKVAGIYTVNTIANNTQISPEGEFADCIPSEAGKPSELLLEDWQVPPVDGFLELGSPWSASSPVSVKGNLYSLISLDPLSSRSEWETVSEWEEADEEVHTLCIQVVPWKLVPIEIPPSWPFHLGNPGVDSKDPRLQKESSYFERH